MKALSQHPKAVYARCWRAKNKERAYEINRQSEIRRKNRNPEKFNEKARLATARWRSRNPDVVRAGWVESLERRLAEREALLGRPRPDICEVCARPSGSRYALHFDHDHKTGAARGWLCNSCNAALGHVDDDIEILEKLIVYLVRSRRPKLRIAV
jgi:hypothetical protein